MTEMDIQRRIIIDRYRRSFVMANFTPRGWWECDVFELTPAGYFREYEIKLTRSDFRADAAKAKSSWSHVDGPRGREWERPEIKKHTQIEAAHAAGPNRFWYVCPSALVTAAELPAWAGLIYATEIPSHNPPWNVSLSLIKAAPRIHAGFAAPKVREHAKDTCYYRMHNLFFQGRATVADGIGPELDSDLTEQPELLKEVAQ